MLYMFCRQSNTLLVHEGETACIECRALADPRPDVVIYHGTTAGQILHELGSPGPHAGQAFTRPGVGVERYVDVAAGGVAVAAYTFPGAAAAEQGGGWSGTEEVPSLRAGVYHCVANNSDETTRRLRFTIRHV